jgi:hypothetical protein
MGDCSVIALLIFASGVGLIAYTCAVFLVGGKLQDWAMANDYPAIAIPWAWSATMLIVVPASIIAAVIA